MGPNRLVIMRLALNAQLDPRTVKRALEKGVDSLQSEHDKVRLRDALKKEEEVALLATKRVTRRCKGAERVSLQTVRESRSKTQRDVAVALGTDEGEMVLIERRFNTFVPLIRKYAEALGARCEVAFVFDDGRRVLIV